MKLFSLDCSTTTASACLIEDGKTIHSSSWFEERARHEGLFDIAEKLMSAAGWFWPDIETFTVGRGPGAYSGLRVSLLAAQSLAAPGNAAVVAVSSMDALAARLMKDNGLDEITIVGDARRNSIWHGRCVATALNETAVDWKVIPLADAPAVLQNAEIVATPHWEALQSLRGQVSELNWAEGPQIPLAEDVAALALRRMDGSIKPDPLLPLYLHPAV